MHPSIAEDYRARLQPFYDAIAALHEDVIVGARGGSDLFVDSGDCVGAALGMMTFRDGAGFDLRAFEHPNVLVDCLLARGWVGPFKMLGPHQSEFFSQLDLAFGLPAQLDLRGKAREFLRSAKVEIEDTEDGVRARATDTHPGFLQSQARSAPKLFRAVECVRGSWQTRVARWRDEQLLRLDQSGVPYHQVFASELFGKLRDAYDALREQRPYNNEADAAALVVLAAKVRQYNSDPERNPLPRFFSNDRFIRDVIHNARADEEFKYESPADGLRRSAICKVDYFHFRATFTPPEDKGGDLRRDREEVETVFRQIGEIIRDVRPLTRDTLLPLTVRGRPLVEVVDELEHFSFLSNVWSWELQHDYVQQAVRELDQAALQLNDSSQQKQLSTALQTVRADLAAGASEFKLARKLWGGIPARAKKLRDCLEDDPDPSKMVRSFGLVRFSFPPEATEELDRWLHALIDSDDDGDVVRTHVVETLLSPAQSDQHALVNRVVVAAVLWVLGFNKEIADTPWSTGRAHHYSLDIVSAAAMRREKYALPKADQLRKDLEVMFEETHDPGVAIGVAYLLGEEWRRHPHAVSYTAPPAALPAQVNELEREYARGLIRSATDYARKGYELLPDEDPRRIYALNLYLFYLAEGADASELPHMRELAEMLRGYRARRPWQYRYDDSIARYHYRDFLTASNAVSRSSALTSAKRDIELALQGSYGMDQSVQVFRDLIADTLRKRQQRARKKKESGKGT